MVPKIKAEVREDLLQNDLKKYRQRAIELGSTDARVITTGDVIIDEGPLQTVSNPNALPMARTQIVHPTQWKSIK